MYKIAILMKGKVMELTQEEVVVRTRRQLGEAFEVFWKSHALLRTHCGQGMAVLLVRRKGETLKGRRVLVCGARDCGHTEPSLVELAAERN